MTNGWIKIHRKMSEHWIWRNPVEFQWWMDILLEANYERKEFRIKNTIYIAERGDVLYSIKTWASRWNTNFSKARRFLKTLEKANMIRYKSESQTVRITVCKYDDYQIDEGKSESHMNRKRIQSESKVNTTKEIKEIKERKAEFRELLIPFKSKYENDMLKDFFDYWTEHGDNDKKMRFEKEKTYGLGRRLSSWKKSPYNKANKQTGLQV